MRPIPKLHPLLTRAKGKTVRLILGAGCHSCHEQIQKLGYPIKYEYPLINALCIDAPKKDLHHLAACEYVRYLHPDIHMKTQLNIAVPATGGDIAFEHNHTGEGVTIAIADTGVYPHADFILPKNRIKAFVDFIDNKTTPYDDNGHGTFVTGVALGNGMASSGVYRGMAPSASLVALKVMDKFGGGTASDILASMQWVADFREVYGIKVFSLSLGSFPILPKSLDPLVRAAEALWELGVVVVCAAGNAGPKSGTITTPGTSPRVITVGAVNDHRTIPQDDDTIAQFSSRGPAGTATKPDLVAPGVNLTSTRAVLDSQVIKTQEDGYEVLSGTSVATPLVSGACAILAQKHPDWSPDQIKEALVSTTFFLGNEPNALGSGELNISNALGLGKDRP